MTIPIDHHGRELDRRAALRRAGLGEGSAAALDRMTSLVCTGLRVPVSLVTLVDGERQYFVSARGLEEPWATRLETPLSHSFCQHVARDGVPLVVNDARQDLRLCGNLAVSEMGVIAYLGVPLPSPSGDTRGTLCAIDHEPRAWTDEQIAFLVQVAGMFTDHLLLRKLRLFSDRSSESHLIVDETGRLVFVNQTACERLGYSAEQLTRLELGAIQPGATADTIRELLARARSGPIDPFESVHRRRDGTTFPVELTVAVVSSGNIERLALTAADITDRKRRVAALAERESRLRFALEAGAMGAWEWDLRGRRIGISEHQATLLGLPPGNLELDETRALALLHRDDRERVEREVRAALAGGEDFEIECRAIRADGAVRWMLVRGQVMLDPLDRPARLLGITLDITERRTTLDELRLRDERIRALLDSTAEGIYGLDLKGRCTFANHACACLLGFDAPDELMGRNMHELVHHHRADGTPYPETECRIFQALRQDRGVHVDDEVLFRRDGTAFPAEYWSYPVRRDGVRVGAVVTFLDITERIEAQRRLVESEVFLRSSIDALATHLAILDDRGRIIRTNRAWDEFARLHGGDHRRTGEGMNYLDVCAAAESDRIAETVRTALQEMLRGDRRGFEIEYPCHHGDDQRWFLLRLTRFDTESGLRLVAAHDDITSRKRAELRLERRSEVLARLNEVNRSLASELDLEQLVNRVTAVATSLCRARFGAFFSSPAGIGGGPSEPSAVSGVSRPQFEQLTLPDAADVFGSMRRGRRVVRIDDLAGDSRFPATGSGGLAVRSLLAVPVATRGGELLGALLFGHPQPGVFTDEAESLVVGVAAQAAAAIDNARLYRDVRRREEEYRGTFENAAVGMAHVGLDGVLLRVNDRFGEIVGREPEAVLALAFPDLVHPDDRDTATSGLEQVARGGAAKSLEELRYLRRDESGVWVQQTASLIVDDEERPSYVALIVQDISDRKQAEQHQNLLVRELSHRVKNLLASVSSIASQTLRQASSLPEFAEAFQGRLAALANVHTLLVQTEWKGASLHSVADRNFAPYAEGHASGLRLEGGDVFLSPRAALTISLVLHELTTNALKYGAWSQRDGTIVLSWEIVGTGPQRTLRLRWAERDGPPVQPPPSEGFGTTLIRKGVEFELDGEADLDYGSTGVVCTLQIPWSAVIGRSHDRAAGAGRVTTASLAGRRILVAEDALAIAHEMETALGEAGAEVIGPFPRLDRLVAAIERPDFAADAALLDVDLRGTDVFPAAELLRDRGVPIVLTTGFAAAHIPPAFQDLPRVEKPVDLDALIGRIAGLLTTPPDRSHPPAR